MGGPPIGIGPSPGRAPYRVGWAPAHANIEGYETVGTEARAATVGIRSGIEPFLVSRSMLDCHLLQWYRLQAQA